MQGAVDKLVPASVSQDYDRMMMLSQTDPAAFLDELKKPPMTQGLIGSVAGIMPIGGMAKEFKPASGKLEDYIAALAKSGDTLATRARLRPAIKTPAGEIFAGDVGGYHPTDLVVDTLNRRGQAAGKLQYGYQPPFENAPFIEADLATHLGREGGPATINSLIKKGISLDTITSMLKEQTKRAAQAAFGQ